MPGHADRQQRAGRKSGKHKGAPVTACQQSDRYQQAELRFVDQQAEETACQSRPLVEQAKAKAEQGRGPGAVLPADRVDENGRRAQANSSAPRPGMARRTAR